jgi:DNA-directed RNA polymerase subunit F
MNSIKYVILTIINLTLLSGVMGYMGYKIALQNLNLVQIENNVNKALTVGSEAKASIEKLDTKQVEAVIKVIVQDEVTKARIAKAEGTAMALSSAVTKLATNPDLVTALNNKEAIKDIAEIVKSPEAKALVSDFAPSNSGSSTLDLKEITDRISKVENSLPEESKKQMEEIAKMRDDAMKTNEELNAKMVAFNALLATFESKNTVSSNFDFLSTNITTTKDQAFSGIALEAERRLASITTLQADTQRMNQESLTLINSLSGMVQTLESKSAVATLASKV